MSLVFEPFLISCSYLMCFIVMVCFVQQVLLILLGSLLKETINVTLTLKKIVVEQVSTRTDQFYLGR